MVTFCESYMNKKKSEQTLRVRSCALEIIIEAQLLFMYNHIKYIIFHITVDCKEITEILNN